MELLTAILSRSGGRENNEDYASFTFFPHATVWVVADGMGGHYGGEIASRCAVETILEGFSSHSGITEENMNKVIQIANEEIINTQKAQQQLRKMQTTAVVVACDGMNTIVAHVGDSRCYVFRQGKLDFQTKDHSVVQVLVNQGEITGQQMRYHEDRNKVLRSLGSNDQVNPTIQLIPPLQSGDSLLLCTDGFWEYVLEREMEVDYFKSISPEEWLTRMEKRLLAKAKSNHDNYSAIAVHVQ